MASNLSLQVILSLVDKLTGPAKEAAKSLDQLGKEARGASEQFDKPVWTEHPRTLERAADAATGLGNALGGVATAAKDAEETLRSPAWVEHGRQVVAAAEAAHGYRRAVGGVGATVSSIPVAPIKEQGQAVEQTTGKVKELGKAHGAAGAAVGSIPVAPIKEQAAEVEKSTAKIKEHGKAVVEAGGAWEQAKQMGVAAVGAVTGTTLIRKMVEGGAERAHTGVGMETAGMTPSESAEFDAEALRLTAKYPTISQNAIKEKLISLRAQTGSAEHALLGIETMLQGEVAIASENAEAARGFEGIGVGLEVAGAFNGGPDKLRKYVDRIVRSVQVNKGTIRPEEYKLYYQHLGSGYAQKLDDEFQYGPLSLLLNEVGGDMAATGHQAFLAEVYGSTVTGRRAEQLEKIGMLPDKSKIHRGKDGHIKYLDPGALRNYTLALSNPDKWLNEELMPRIRGAGLSEDEQDLLFKAMWQRETGFKFASLLVNQRGRSERDTRLQREAPGIDAWLTWLQKDPTTALAAATTQMGNIISGAGMPLMPSLMGDLRALGGAAGWWNQLTAGHEAVNTLGVSGVALAGAALTWQALKDMGVKTFAGRVLSGATGLGVSYLLKEGLDVMDPGGNLWGLTGPIDSYFKRKYGWNPANLFDRGAPPEGWQYDPLYDPNSPTNVQRTNRSLRRAGYLTGGLQTGYHDTGELAAEQDRESRRAWAYSPDVQPATAEALDLFKAKAKEAQDQLRALEQPIHPTVDAGSLDALEAKLRSIVAMIGLINGGIGRLGTTSVGPFTPRPAAPLHDGPEAR